MSKENTDEDTQTENGDRRGSRGGGARTGNGGRNEENKNKDGMREFLEKTVLLALVVFGFLVAIRTYLSASAFIGSWIDPRYVDLFQAGFNLAVLLLIAAAVLKLKKQLDLS